MRSRTSLPLAGVALAIIAAFAPQRAEATSIIFDATTTGCFAVSGSCTPTNTNAIAGDLSFAGVTNNASSPTSVTANTSGTATIDLGTFSIPTSGNASANPYTVFDLNVQFTNPLNSGAQIFPATLVGQITGGPNNKITVNFSQTPTTFSYVDYGGSGTFQLTLPDINLSNISSTGYSPSLALTGTITNVVWTASSPLSAVPTPEPASLLLLGTGMLGTAIAARRRLSASKKSQRQ